MKECCNLICVVDEGRIESNLFLNEREEIYQIELKMNDSSFSAEGENYFDALINLRKKLELKNIKILCKGCSKFVYPSPMILNMGDAIQAYELVLGEQAHSKDIVNIFEPCRYDEYATIDEQYAYYEKWIESRKVR